MVSKPWSVFPLCRDAWRMPQRGGRAQGWCGPPAGDLWTGSMNREWLGAGEAAKLVAHSWRCARLVAEDCRGPGHVVKAHKAHAMRHAETRRTPARWLARSARPFSSSWTRRPARRSRPHGAQSGRRRKRAMWSRQSVAQVPLLIWRGLTVRRATHAWAPTQRSGSSKFCTCATEASVLAG